MEYPYTLTPDKLKQFHAKLLSAGTPSRVDRTYLKSHGFASSNHQAFIPIMKALGLLDGAGKPTDDYVRVYRHQDRAHLAALIRTTYAQLFSQYSDANRRDTEALRNFFRASTTGADRVITAMVSTFQTLCALADFEAEPEATPAGLSAAVAKPQQIARHTEPLKQSPAVALNVNLQVQLPATTDADVYDKLFAAMAKHLIRLGDD